MHSIVLVHYCPMCHSETFELKQKRSNIVQSFKFSQVKYAPKVSVSVIGGALAGGRIPEGAEVRLSCHSDANPSDVTYRWYVNEELVVGDYTTEMVSSVQIDLITFRVYVRFMIVYLSRYIRTIKLIVPMFFSLFA